jgi:hypothetical protein
MIDVYSSGDQEFDAFPEVVATINDSETGNDVICGRQSRGSPPPLQNRELKTVDGRIVLGSAHQSMIGLSARDNWLFAYLGNADELEAPQYQ